MAGGRRLRGLPASPYSWAAAILVAALALKLWLALVPRELTHFAGLALVYLAATSLATLDLIDLALRLRERRRRSDAAEPVLASVRRAGDELTAYGVRLHLRPWAIVVSVHDAVDLLPSFLSWWRPYLDRLWVVDDASRDGTWQWLQDAGVRCVRSEENLRKPGAIRHLLRELPPDVATVLVLDPDTRLVEQPRPRQIPGLELAILDFQRSGAAAACPRITMRDGGLLERFQVFECDVGFDLGRRSLGDFCVTSGVALYRRDALEKVLASHTLSVYAEDLQNSFALLATGERIYYDGRITFETQAKHTWREWFAQRVGWHYGLLEVYVRYARRLWEARTGRPLFYVYQNFVYVALFGFALLPLKLAGLAVLLASAVDVLAWAAGRAPETLLAHPAYFLAYCAKYLIYTGLAALATVEAGQRLDRLPAMALFSIYAPVRLLASTVGYGNWLSLRLRGRRLFKDYYEDGP